MPTTAPICATVQLQFESDAAIAAFETKFNALFGCTCVIRRFDPDWLSKKFSDPDFRRWMASSMFSQEPTDLPHSPDRAARSGQSGSQGLDP